jgi:hypothetical protein
MQPARQRRHTFLTGYVYPMRLRSRYTNARCHLRQLFRIAPCQPKPGPTLLHQPGCVAANATRSAYYQYILPFQTFHVKRLWS